MKTAKTRKHPGNTPKKTTGPAKRRWELSDEWREKLSRIQVILGVAIIGVCAVAGFFINPAVGIGLAVLAGLRLFFLRREMRRQANEEAATPPEPQPTPKGRSQAVRTT